MRQHRSARLIGLALFDRGKNGVVLGKRMVIAVRSAVGRVEPAPDNNQPHPVQDAVHRLQQGVARSLCDGFVKTAVQIFVAFPTACHRVA